MALSTTLPNVFSSLNIQDLVDAFGLQKTDQTEILSIKITDLQSSRASELVNLYQNEIEYWNEQELIIKYLSPILNLIDFRGNNYNSFAERTISASVDGILLTGITDFVVARGKYEPRNPYFFIQEFKKAKNPTGDPFAQLLGEMLVAQVLNQSELVYGLYIVGRFWYFVALENRNYTEILPLDSTNLQDLEIILSKLNWIKNWVREKVENL